MQDMTDAALHDAIARLERSAETTTLTNRQRDELSTFRNEQMMRKSDAECLASLN